MSELKNISSFDKIILNLKDIKERSVEFKLNNEEYKNIIDDIKEIYFYWEYPNHWHHSYLIGKTDKKYFNLYVYAEEHIKERSDGYERYHPHLQLYIETSENLKDLLSFPEKHNNYMFPNKKYGGFLNDMKGELENFKESIYK
jgi:hypothetical protein